MTFSAFDAESNRALTMEVTMPKGYNDRAIAGMLEFLKGCFECVLEEVEAGKPVKQALTEELAEIERMLRRDHRATSVRFEDKEQTA